MIWGWLAKNKTRCALYDQSFVSMRKKAEKFTTIKQTLTNYFYLSDLVKIPGSVGYCCV